MIVVLVLGTKLLGQFRLPAPAAGRGPVELPAGTPSPTLGPQMTETGTPQPAVAAAPAPPPIEVGDPEMAAKLLRSWMKES
jgi:hypothetical protein